MGCLVRVVGLIFANLVSRMLLLLARLVFIFLWLLALLVGRLLIALSGWMLVSLAALYSPRRSADVIVARIVDRGISAGVNGVANPFILQTLYVFVIAGFALGWGMSILLVVQIIRWVT